MINSVSNKHPPLILTNQKALTEEVRKDSKDKNVKVSEITGRMSVRRSSSTGQIQTINSSPLPLLMAAPERRKSKSFPGFDEIDGMAVDFSGVPAFLNEEDGVSSSSTEASN
nr:hypothetical transcript [Hymenolepis microstoma]